MGRNNILWIYHFRLEFLDYKGINFSILLTPQPSQGYGGVIIKVGVINKVGMFWIFFVFLKVVMGSKCKLFIALL